MTRAPDIPNVFFLSCLGWDAKMQKTTDPKKQKCKNCEGKGTLKKGIRSCAVKGAAEPASSGEPWSRVT